MQNKNSYAIAFFPTKDEISFPLWKSCISNHNWTNNVDLNIQLAVLVSFQNIYFMY